MQHIVHLTSAHPVLDTRIFYKECSSLAQRGYQVTLIAQHQRNEIRNGVQIRALPKPTSRAQRIFSTLKIYHLALKENADLYHIHDPELLPTGLLLRLQGKKVVYDIHEDLPRSLRANSRNYIPESLKHGLSWFVEKLEDLASAQFSGLVAATSTIDKRFKGINAHITIANNYPLLEEFTETPAIEWANRAADLVYIGVIAEERGITEIVKAMAMVNEVSHAKLELAGVISPATLEEKLRELEEWQYVNYRGTLTRPDIAQLLSMVQVGLVILHPMPSFIVAMPVKMFEYMAAGIPIIASDFPLWREIVESTQCGLLVDPLDLQAIGEAIIYLLQHPQQAEQMGRNGRLAVETQYNWDIECTKLIQLYADLQVYADLQAADELMPQTLLNAGPLPKTIR